ncbi:MAG: C1 family peptidase [Eubacterium sp.]|nr:C1 family peptidase [Eubacterium sp.]
MKKTFRLTSLSLALVLSISVFGGGVSARERHVFEPQDDGTFYHRDGQMVQSFLGESFEITDVGRQRGLSADTLTSTTPAAADNSTLRYFPEIGDQGNIGSCEYWAQVYYTYTHMYSLKKNIDVKTLGDKAAFSPAFNYHGPHFSMSGAMTLHDMPYDMESEDNFRYPTNAQAWRDAISKKAKVHYAYVSEGKNYPYNEILLKKYLANGYVFVAGVRVDAFSSPYNYVIQDNPNSVADDVAIGEKVPLYRQATGTAHAVTVVGYNDDIWYDRNGNNIMDWNELGGFKIANSWGKNWCNNGFVWVSYYDFVNTCSLQNSGIFTILPPDEPYVPTLLAEVDYKGESLSIGIVPANFDISHRADESEFVHLGRPMDGTMVIDLTTAVDPTKGLVNINTMLYNFVLKGSSATLRGFRITDGTGKVLASYNGPPTTTGAGSNNILASITYGYHDGNTSWNISFDPLNGEEKITFPDLKRGDVINSSGVPAPTREGYVFRGWQDVRGNLITFPYFVNGSDILTARWSTNYGEMVDLDLERILFDTGTIGRARFEYRRFTSKDASSAPVINEKTKWKPLKSYTFDGRDFADISNIIDNKKNVALELKVIDSYAEEENNCVYYFTPREQAIKVKISKNDGYTAMDGFAKLEVSGTNSDIVYRSNVDDIAATAANQNGFIYLPVGDGKQNYLLKSKTDNTGRDGLSFETALKPGSKPVKLSIPASAKEPNVTVDWTKDAIKLKTTMEISLDKKAWYPVSSNPSEPNSAIFYKDLNGISVYDKLINGQSMVYVRTAGTPKKQASKIAAVYLGPGNSDQLTTEDLLSANGKSVFGKEAVMQYIPASGLSLNESGDLVITGKQKWKEGALSIPKNGGDYYLRMASTGASRPGKPVKMTLKQGDEAITVEAKTKALKIKKAPSVKINTAQDSITLKAGMEVLSNRGEWLKVSTNPSDELYFNPSIGGVSLYDDGIAYANDKGGIIYRKSADSKSAESASKFLPLPDGVALTLSENTLTTLDGKSFCMRGSAVQYIEADNAPTSKLENGILLITDKKAKWKAADQIKLKIGSNIYFIRSVSEDGTPSRVLKVKAVNENFSIRFEILE